MRVAYLFLGLLALTAARSFKKRGDDDENHWVSGYLATVDNDFDDDKKASIVSNIMNDLKFFKAVVEKTLSGENGGQSKYEILEMLSGGIHLVEMHEKKAEEGHSMIPAKSVSIPEGCNKDDIIALKECKLMVNQALNCIKGGTQAVLDVLSSDNQSFEDKIGALKAMIGKIVGELDNIRMLFNHCVKPFLPAHWEQAWKLTEADLSDPDVTEQKYADMGMQIYKDATAIKNNLDILLSGQGSEREFKEAHKHLTAAVMLAKLHEEQGAGTVQPEDVPVEAQCTKEEISKLADCGEKYFRVGTCLRAAVDKMIQRMENNNRDYVGLVKYVKGVVLNIAKAPEVLQEIASTCSVLDIEHWEKAWLITEEELKDPANLEKFKKLGERIHNDLVEVRENLAALLEGRGGDINLALQHLEAAVKLAALHEDQGAGSITPSNIPAEAGCTKDAVLALDGCESKAIKIGTCIKGTVDDVLNEMRTNTNIVEVAMFTKGSVLNLAKADAVVKDVIASCEKEDDERELKRELLKLLRRRGN